ncbi:metallophosphoesterase [Shewanella maritima]|uniref:metallophosphoesterase n=1 Tax=Shewanella maritima TaxID=2520507 RepID=UPI0037366FCB
MKLNKDISRRSFLGGSMKVATVATAAPILSACNSDSSSPEKPDISGVQVAMLADVHFHDVFGDYEFANYHSEVTIRSMQDSCESTRMFNENYFAFISALEELGEQGVKYICLLGDFSDDGQVDTLKGFNRVVQPFIEKYQFEFFITNGNHDPVRPYGRDETKRFLHHTGASVEVTSDENRGFTPGNVVISQHVTQGMWGTGYQEMFEVLGEYGFQNKPSYFYYETPWGSDEFDKRGLMIAKEEGGTEYWCPDASYLAEPIEGLWIVSVDMNVYLPDEDGNWSHASVGWEEGKHYKPQVMDWLTDVTSRAEQLGKTLVVFSHYPATEYLNSSANDFYYVFNDGSYNNTRVPSTDTAEQVIETGVKVHFGGHIHVNDTAVHHSKKGTLVNIQAPSLAAYTPSYKLVTCHTASLFEVETKTLTQVKDFDALFPYYQQELEHREWVGEAVLWKQMLEATDYRDFMFRHLDVLMNMRLKNGWGADISTLFELKTPLYWLMALSALDAELSNQQALLALESMTETASNNDIIALFDDFNLSSQMTAALAIVDSHISDYSLSRDHFISLGFNTVCLTSLYQRNGDELAFEDVTYQLMTPIYVAMDLFAANDADGDLDNINWETDYVDQNPASGGSIKIDEFDLSTLKTRFASLARMYHQFRKAQPADHFYINLNSGIVEDLAGNKLF